ncbi:uncharacterized protein FIBRA_09344 [Fibroporia radiculosa]|uniref:Uncharacterized protein n=1 Tax=Fibroporia radiculosa TaxID=599839 RepID=J7RVT2_9APHY|nr:uncharacterized protein FIBRA_09344 [Fibroporia radiculosa]CCM07025.1 predicted protein [Fibroporia radiculosa]
MLAQQLVIERFKEEGGGPAQTKSSPNLQPETSAPPPPVPKFAPNARPGTSAPPPPVPKSARPPPVPALPNTNVRKGGVDKAWLANYGEYLRGGAKGTPPSSHPFVPPSQPAGQEDRKSPSPEPNPYRINLRALLEELD